MKTAIWYSEVIKKYRDQSNIFKSSFNYHDDEYIGIHTFLKRLNEFQSKYAADVVNLFAIIPDTSIIDNNDQSFIANAGCTNIVNVKDNCNINIKTPNDETELKTFFFILNMLYSGIDHIKVFNLYRSETNGYPIAIHGLTKNEAKYEIRKDNFVYVMNTKISDIPITDIFDLDNIETNICSGSLVFKMVNHVFGNDYYCSTNDSSDNVFRSKSSKFELYIDHNYPGYDCQVVLRTGTLRTYQISDGYYDNIDEFKNRFKEDFQNEINFMQAAFKKFKD